MLSNFTRDKSLARFSNSFPALSSLPLSVPRRPNPRPARAPCCTCNSNKVCLISHQKLKLDGSNNFFSSIFAKISLGQDFKQIAECQKRKDTLATVGNTDD